MRGLYQFHAFNRYLVITQLIPTLTYGIALTYSLTLAADRLDLTTIFLAILGVEAALSIWGIVMLFRSPGVRFSTDYTSFLKPVFRYSLKGLIITLGHFLNKRLDVWFVQYFKGTVALGYYGLATQVANFISEAMTPFNQVLVPYVSGSPSEEHREIVERTARLNLLIATSAAVIIVLTSWLFIPVLFGKKFAAAIPATQILAFGIICISQRLVFTGYFRATDRLRFPFRAAWTGVVVTVILDIILIPRHGITGAALATIAAYTVSAAYLIWSAKKALGFAWTDIFIPRRDDLRWLLQKSKQKV